LSTLFWAYIFFYLLFGSFLSFEISFDGDNSGVNDLLYGSSIFFCFDTEKNCTFQNEDKSFLTRIWEYIFGASPPPTEAEKANPGGTASTTDAAA